MNHPLVIVIAGAGGVGKGTVARALVARDQNLWLSRSWTTRLRRDGEDADAYHFATDDEFANAVESGVFMEWAEFQGNRYGTPWPRLSGEQDVVLEIDVQGAAQVHQRLTDALIFFLLPPSMDELRRRLVGRGDPPDKIEQRLAIAASEREAASKLNAIEVVNATVEGTVDALLTKIVACRAREI